MLEMKTLSTHKYYSFHGHFSSSKYCDVKFSTLDGFGRVLTAHKVVLAAASVKLEKLIDSAGEKVGPLIVRNIRFDVLEKILELIYFGKVEIEDTDIEDFQDGIDMLRVSVTEHGDQSEALQQMKSVNVTNNEEFRNSSQRSFLSNMSFNNNSADVSNSSEVVLNNLEGVQANPNLVNGGRSKTRPFHAGSIIGSAAGSDKDKVTITKRFSNPYLTENEFSSTESEPEKDEPSPDQTTNKIPNTRSIPDQLKLPCNFCQLKFKLKFSLERHIKSAHELIKRSCHLCPLKFTNKHSLVRHIKTVHDQTRISCRLCPSKFTARRGLREHVASVHEKIEVLCNLCPLKFTKKGNLARHIKSVHKQIRIPCSQCPLKFASKRNLVKHMSNMHQKKGNPGIEPSCGKK